MNPGTHASARCSDGASAHVKQASTVERRSVHVERRVSDNGVLLLTMFGAGTSDRLFQGVGN